MIHINYTADQHDDEVNLQTEWIQQRTLRWRWCVTVSSSCTKMIHKESKSGKSWIMFPDLSSDRTFRFWWASLNDGGLTLFRLLHSTPLGIKQCIHIQHNPWIKVQISSKVLMKHQGHVQKIPLPKAVKCQSLFSRSLLFSVPRGRMGEFHSCLFWSQSHTLIF